MANPQFQNPAVTFAGQTNPHLNQGLSNPAMQNAMANYAITPDMLNTAMNVNHVTNPAMMPLATAINPAFADPEIQKQMQQAMAMSPEEIAAAIEASKKLSPEEVEEIKKKAQADREARLAAQQQQQ